MDTIAADVGTHLMVELIDDRGDRETLSFDIVPEQAADFDQGRLSETTPLAQAIVGRVAGDVVAYEMGDVRSVRILSIQPAQTVASEDVAAQRDAATKKALDAIERTNAAIFASSFSGKWGDYDPGGVETWEE